MHVWTGKGGRLDIFAILGISAIALSRILFRSRLLYDIDSVNFALGIFRFDPAAHQPHPPGYFLYVCLARLVNLFLTDPNTALVAISIGASCAAAGVGAASRPRATADLSIRRSLRRSF